MKRLSILTLALILLSVTVSSASEFVIRPSGFWVPKQELSVVPPGGAIAEFDLDNSFGGFLEIAKYSPEKYLSFGFEGGFENLQTTNPVPGISKGSAKVFSLMAKGCGHVQNRTAFTPFGCGGVGMLVIDPDLQVASGPAISLGSVTTSGFSLEAGGTYALTHQVAARAGVRMMKAFDDPVFSVGGGGLGVPMDIDHYGVFFGLEF